MLSYQSLMSAAAGTPAAGTPRYESGGRWYSGIWDLVVGSVWVWLVPPFPSGFRPRIGVRGMLSIAGMTVREIGGIPRHYRSRATLFSYQ